ncbi:unnamed protein product [Phytophthora lilii]|uniref:Unnamed protein product n=1 Tax=Phytophthora lilii TaxID=2077276 RepID=A0A9W6U9P5_9STRA|nr:unnamed protein product [Phytophthora lilii]
MNVHLLAVARGPADGEVGGRVAIEQNLSFDRAARLASGDDVHERGLACTRGPHERRNGARQRVSADPLEQVDGVLGVGRVRHAVSEILDRDKVLFAAGSDEH